MGKKRRYTHNRHLDGHNPYGMSPFKKTDQGEICINSILKFGKYIGLKAKDVLKLNPGYFVWLSENTNNKINPILLVEDIKNKQTYTTSRKKSTSL